jgi:hypothetical protein
LFANDFDQDEIDTISVFFNVCEQIDSFCTKDNNFIWITTEERARVVQQQLPQLVVAAYDQDKGTVDTSKLDLLKVNLLDTITSDEYTYSPR